MMTTEEHQALVEGKKTSTDVLEDRKVSADNEQEEVMSARNLLLSRSYKTIFVHFEEVDIEIYANLTISEIASLPFIALYDKVVTGKEDVDILEQPGNIKLFHDFLTYITVDESLNDWRSIDFFVCKTILDEYTLHQLKELISVKKFRR